MQGFRQKMSGLIGFFISFPLGISHILKVWSVDPVDKCCLLGENTRLQIQPECPMSVLIFWQVDVVYRVVVLFLDPGARISPFGEKATLSIGEEFT